MTVKDAFKAFRRVHSPLVFMGIVFAFFLPFATVSCNDAETTFTGVQLVTRTVPEGGVIDETEGEISDRVEQQSSALAAVILVLAVAGFLLGVLGVERGPGWVAGLGTILTIALAEDAIGFSLDGPTVELLIGYQLALGLFAWVWLVHVVRAFRRRAAEPRAGGVTAPL
jgi:hypothetical protein